MTPWTSGGNSVAEPEQQESDEGEIHIRSFHRGAGFMEGLKLAIIMGLMLPFIVFLIPVWYLYVLAERMAGRPRPAPPWRETMNILLRRNARDDAAPRSVFPGKDGGKNATTAGGDATAVQESPPGVGRTPLPRVTAISEQRRGGVALVTGGARRMGAALCRDLAQQGFRVAVVYHRSGEEAQALVQEIRARGGEAEAFACDLSNPAHMENLLAQVSRQLGRLRLLVHNAAQFLPTDPRHVTWEGMERLLRVNLHGPLWLSLKAAPRMDDGGLILMIGDIWGERPLAGHAAYGASKAGLLMATQVLARDLAPRLRVNAIAPGAILEPDHEEESSYFGRMLQRTPLAEAASPDAVLLAVRYLLEAEFVTGEVLHVEGGRRLG